MIERLPLSFFLFPRQRFDSDAQKLDTWNLARPCQENKTPYELGQSLPSAPSKRASFHTAWAGKAAARQQSVKYSVEGK